MGLTHYLVAQAVEELNKQIEALSLVFDVCYQQVEVAKNPKQVRVGTNLIQTIKMTEVEKIDNIPSINRTYKTRELNWWQKLLQVYWVNPKSWLLDEFTIDDTLITIKLKNGKVMSAQVDEISVKIKTDKSDRRECYITHNAEKLHFKEIAWMLTDEEWDEVFEIFSVTVDSRLTKAAWALTVAKKILEFTN